MTVFGPLTVTVVGSCKHTFRSYPHMQDMTMHDVTWCFLTTFLYLWHYVLLEYLAYSHLETLIFSIISDCTFCCFFLHVQEISCTCRKFPECVGNFLAHHADSSYKITKYTIIPAHVGKYSIWLEIFLLNHSDSSYIIIYMCRKFPGRNSRMYSHF